MTTENAADGAPLDSATLLAQLETLGGLGADPMQGGRTRLALSDAEKAGRDQLVAWMRDLDLTIAIDRIGNIFGTLPAADGVDRPVLMIGSHIDTVANAGALDGCYGVLAGLAIARSFRRAGRLPSRPITVAAFTNEEGARYQPDMLGSLVHVGGLALNEALDTVGTDGTRLGDELARIGYAGAIEPGAIATHEYLELHIEQGPILEAEGLQIGVVENLQGISWSRVTVQGNANHAGTTPIRLRHDAGWVAAAASVFLRDLAQASGGSTLATVGSLSLEPNIINVIARKAVFTVDLRDPDEQRLQEAERRLAAFFAEIAAKEGVRIKTEQLARFEPVVFDPDLVAEIEAATINFGHRFRRMTSGAGHDAQMIARIAPSAMIFVPSAGGVSHNPREHTDPADLVRGAELLLDVVRRRLKST